MTSDADRIIDVYRRHGPAWARDRGDRLVEGAWLDRFVSLLPDDPSVLDIGCGSGRPIARALIERGCDVSGVDAAPEMIALCVEAFPGRDWRVADMRALSLGRTFDGLVAWDRFWHLSPDDQRLTVTVFRAHAAPGAALLFTSGPADGVAVGTLGGEPLYHASLDGDEYRALLDAHGFEVVARGWDAPARTLLIVWIAGLRTP